MYINEITPNSNVRITAIMGSKRMEFDTQVMGSLEEIPGLPSALKIKPIFQDGKVLNFNIGGLVCNALLINEADLLPYEWKDVKIRVMKGDELCHVILTQKEANALNRRGNYRIWLGFEGIAQIGMNAKTHNVMIKDISAGGLSFICEETGKLKRGTPTSIAFYDDIKKINFKLNVKVVHIEEINEKEMIYGCQLKEESNSLRKYINEKQIERARLNRTVPLHKHA